MKDTQFAALQDAVTLARSGEIFRATALKAKLEQAGHNPEDVDAALEYWSAQLHDRYPGGEKKLALQMHLEGYPT